MSQRRHDGWRGPLAVLAGVTLAVLTALPAYAGTGTHTAAGKIAQTGARLHANALPAAVRHARTPAIRKALTADYAAQARASATHRPVLVTADTTEVSQTVANPNGTFTYTNTQMPVRVNRDGKWVPISTRLRASGGRLRPTAVPSGVMLSDGGRGSLAELTSLAGGRLTLASPVKSLPRPTVSGGTATYRLARGLSLHLSVTTEGGLTETLVLANRSAATAARQLNLGLTGAHGLRVAADRYGNVAGHAGKLAEFTSPPAELMASAAPRVHGMLTAGKLGLAGRPLPATLSDPMGLTATAGTATAYPASITRQYAPDLVIPDSGPSAGLLNPETTCSIPCKGGAGGSPSYNCANTTSGQPLCTDEPGFDETQGSSGTCSTYKNYDTEQPTSGVETGASGKIYGNGTGWMDYGGTCNDSQYEAYYTYYLTGLVSGSMVIASADIYATLTGSAQIASGACSATTWPLDLWSTGNVGANTDGANPPVNNSDVNDISADLGPNPSDTCQNVALKFKVASLMDTAISRGWNNMGTGIAGDTSQSSTDYGFSRIGDDPDLQASFDLPPATPYDATINGTTSCDQTGFTQSDPWINTTKAVLEADTTVQISGESAAGSYAIDDGVTAGVTSYTTAYQPPESNGTTVQFPTYTMSVADGNQYEWTAMAQTNGDGEADPDGPILSNGDINCFFNVDTTPPKLTAVTSSAFPQDGTTDYAGSSGTFTLTGNDPLPTAGDCDQSPNPCWASGIKDFEYSLNDPTIPAGGFTSDTATTGYVAAPANSGGSSVQVTTPSVTVGTWGENIMYVEAIDTAGNVSGKWYYYFTVPWNPASKATPGDVNGDGIPDLLATTSSGDLDLYAGTSATAVSFPASPATADNPGDGPDQNGADWNDFDITHRGSNTSNDVDDLYALGPAAGSGDTTFPGLYVIKNNLSPSNQYQSTNASLVTNPECATSYDASNSCADYVYNSGDTDEWQTASASNPDSGISQILAIGPNDALGNSGNANLLAVENGGLYFFTGEGSGQFGTGSNWTTGDTPGPVLIGSSTGSGSSGTTTWANMTLLATGTEGPPGTITFWARDNNTADSTAGDIYSYAISFSGGIPSLSSSGPVTATSGALLQYSSGSDVNISPATYPTIATTGNSDGPASIYAYDAATGGIEEYAGYLYSGTSGTAEELLQPGTQVATVTPNSITQLS
jgi:hypothetical protein